MTGTAPRYRFGSRVPIGQAELVSSVLLAHGWEPSDEGWRLWWDSGTPPDDVFGAMPPGGFVNHFPDIDALALKSGLADTLSQASARAPSVAPQGIPMTFVCPRDHAALRSVTDDGALWIKKPLDGARGEGITLTDDLSTIDERDVCVVQRYVSNPDLIDGYKYTLRCYLLIASTDPLLVYLFEDGFVKLTSKPFTTDRASLSDAIVHLTNPEIQQGNREILVSERNLTHQEYRARMREQGSDVDALFGSIRRLAALAAIAAREPIRAEQVRRAARPDGCFELLGLDVIVDETKTPWLLECNLGPSLSVIAEGETKANRDEARIKRSVVEDTLRIMGLLDLDDRVAPDPVARSRAQEERSGGFGRVWPAPDTLDLRRFMALPRESDAAVTEAVTGQRLAPASTTFEVPAHVLQRVVGQAVVLFDEGSRKASVLNDSASFIWSAAAEGCSVEQITREMVDATGQPSERVRTDVEDAIGYWVNGGMLSPPDAEPFLARADVHDRGWDTTTRPFIGWNDERIYDVLGCRISVRYPSDAIAAWADPVFAHLAIERPGAVDAVVEVSAEPAGLRISVPDTSWLIPTVASLAPSIRWALGRIAATAARLPLVSQGVAVEHAARCALIIGEPPEAADVAAVTWASAGAMLVADHIAAFSSGRPAIEPLILGMADRWLDWIGKPPEAPGPGAAHVDLDGYNVRLLARPDLASARASPLGAIVIATLATSKEPPVCDEISADVAFASLQSSRLGPALIDRRAIGHVMDVVSSVPAYRLTFNRWWDSSDLLDAIRRCIR
jgi:hypothetical protein